jgi:hypothetical protein
MRGTRLPGLLLNEPVGDTTAGMICVSPRCYLVMTGRLQVKQQKGRPSRNGPVSGTVPVTNLCRY